MDKGESDFEYGSKAVHICRLSLKPQGENAVIRTIYPPGYGLFVPHAIDRLFYFRPITRVASGTTYSQPESTARIQLMFAVTLTEQTCTFQYTSEFELPSISFDPGRHSFRAYLNFFCVTSYRYVEIPATCFSGMKPQHRK